MLSYDGVIIREIMVPIEKAALFSDLQMRIVLPEKTIVEYAAAMRAGCDFPPLECAELDGELLVYDGFLRNSAYRQCGITQIKVRVRPVESRDEAILWAVKAQAHEGLARKNADKQNSVRMLLDTDLGKSMSNVDIAKEAGVTAEYVRKLRQQQESRISNQQLDSESRSKVKTSRGLRPKKYKKHKAQAKPMVRPPYEPVKWPTREETGAPPPELMNEPHPDNPGLTYGQVFTRDNGFVQIFPLAEKRRQDNLINTREVLGLVRDIGVVCHKFVPAMAKITVADLFATLAGMESKKWSRELNTYRETLVTALPLIAALLEASKECKDC